MNLFTWYLAIGAVLAFYLRCKGMKAKPEDFPDHQKHIYYMITDKKISPMLALSLVLVALTWPGFVYTKTKKLLGFKNSDS